MDLFKKQSLDTLRLNPEFDIVEFKEIIGRIKIETKPKKEELIRKLHELKGLVLHHSDKDTGRKILHAYPEFQYNHEFHTAKKIVSEDYDVLFLPDGYFKRSEKKFDVLVSKRHILLQADLKCISSENSDTVGNRIREGSEQASRVVLDIHSNIDKRNLIEGLKTGCERNRDIVEIWLFFSKRFYILPKNQILSKRIFDVI